MALTAAAQSYTICSGPASVVLRGPAEFSDYQRSGSGIGIIEMAHRSEAFLAVFVAAEANFRNLLTVSDVWRDWRFKSYKGRVVWC